MYIYVCVCVRVSVCVLSNICLVNEGFETVLELGVQDSATAAAAALQPQLTRQPCRFVWVGDVCVQVCVSEAWLHTHMYVCMYVCMYV
jgi:hypothetical protein